MDKLSMISYLNAIGGEVSELRDTVIADRKLIPDMEEISAIKLVGEELIKSGKDILKVAVELEEKFLK